MSQAIAKRSERTSSETWSMPREIEAGKMGQPFRSAEDAWFWTMQSLIARQQGISSSGCALPRPCTPDDVVKCLDALYQRRRIDLAHARVLRAWGERNMAPDISYAAERAEAQLWHEALARLEWSLRVKGIVVSAS